MLQPQSVLSIPVVTLLAPLPHLKKSSRNSQYPFHDQSKALAQYKLRLQHAKILEISISPKMGVNFMAWLRGVVYHLPRLKIHETKPNCVGIYHVKGIWDWSIYKRNNPGLEIFTCRE